jgi:hypothetical protein
MKLILSLILIVAVTGIFSQEDFYDYHWYYDPDPGFSGPVKSCVEYRRDLFPETDTSSLFQPFRANEWDKFYMVYLNGENHVVCDTFISYGRADNCHYVYNAHHQLEECRVLTGSEVFTREKFRYTDFGKPCQATHRSYDGTEDHTFFEYNDTTLEKITITWDDPEDTVFAVSYFSYDPKHNLLIDSSVFQGGYEIRKFDTRSLLLLESYEETEWGEVVARKYTFDDKWQLVEKKQWQGEPGDLELIEQVLYNYSENGYEYKVYYTTGYGGMRHAETHFYDNRDNCLRTEEYFTAGNKITVYVYLFDAAGNWTRQVKFVNSVPVKAHVRFFEYSTIK